MEQTHRSFQAFQFPRPPNFRPPRAGHVGTGWPQAPRACGRLSSIDFRARFPPRRRRVRHRRRSCGPIEFSSPRRQALNIHTLESLLPCTRPPVVACPPALTYTYTAAG